MSMKNKKAGSRQYFYAIPNILKSKRSFEMSFAMIFSIIAGSIILFLAIYAATRVINIQKSAAYTGTAKSIDNYFGALVTGTASAAGTVLDFKKEIRVYTSCESSGTFGSQTTGYSEKSGVGEKWSDVGGKIKRVNKYIFANGTESGKKMYFFIKPLFFGFKVDDMIMMSGSEYCFVENNMPNSIKGAINDLGLANVNVSSISGCKKDSIKVCFGSNSAGCDVLVHGDDSEYETGYISKDGRLSYYAGNLLYAAIFSSPDIYECNVQRLGKKTAALADLYSKKIDIVKSSGCDSNIGSYLEKIKDRAGSISSSQSIGSIYRTAAEMDEKNRLAMCKIYPGENY